MVDAGSFPPVICSPLLPCFLILLLYLAFFGEVRFPFLAFLEAMCGQWDVGGKSSNETYGCSSLRGPDSSRRHTYILVCESPLSCFVECGQGLFTVVLNILAPRAKRLRENSALMSLSCWTKVINYYTSSPYPLPHPWNSHVRRLDPYLFTLLQLDFCHYSWMQSLCDSKCLLLLKQLLSTFFS